MSEKPWKISLDGEDRVKLIKQVDCSNYASLRLKVEEKWKIPPQSFKLSYSTSQNGPRLPLEDEESFKNIKGADTIRIFIATTSP